MIFSVRQVQRRQAKGVSFYIKGRQCSVRSTRYCARQHITSVLSGSVPPPRCAGVVGKSVCVPLDLVGVVPRCAVLPGVVIPLVYLRFL